LDVGIEKYNSLTDAIYKTSKNKLAKDTAARGAP